MGLTHRCYLVRLGLIFPNLDVNPAEAYSDFPFKICALLQSSTIPKKALIHPKPIHSNQSLSMSENDTTSENEIMFEYGDPREER